MVKDPAGTLLKAGHGGRVEGSGDNSRPRNASLLPSSLSRHYFHRIHDVKIGRGSGGFVCVNVNSFGRFPHSLLRPQYPRALFTEFNSIHSSNILAYMIRDILLRRAYLSLKGCVKLALEAGGSQKGEFTLPFIHIQ